MGFRVSKFSSSIANVVPKSFTKKGKDKVDGE
ncbi:hypothetical protein ES332_D01G040900v1 [Gossypium tomentosum]|uniref:Uncharacterized protein n=1 Tax=Gossypium tomentosum TaxID=34277 RepID=A0A5D2M503_GOSTO|nr:hypothetical protein ES332_D01G040900v1 [Gossypium tomentosum]